MDIQEKIYRQNEAILRELKSLNKPKARWVKASVITELTGWDGQRMRRARENGLLEFKKDEGGYWYDINSLPSQLIKKQTA